MRINRAFLLISLSGTIVAMGPGKSEAQRGEVGSSTSERIVGKDIPDILVAGIRMKGTYSEMDKAFQKLGRSVGRHIGGKGLTLFYDRELKKDDADFEPCFPVEKKVNVDGIACRTIKGGKAITLIHRGPYDTLKESYARIHEYRKARGLKIRLPTREVYLKGPGRFFKGNPKNYVTEIQLIVEPAPSGE